MQARTRTIVIQIVVWRRDCDHVVCLVSFVRYAMPYEPYYYEYYKQAENVPEYNDQKPQTPIQLAARDGAPDWRHWRGGRWVLIR